MLSTLDTLLLCSRVIVYDTVVHLLTKLFPLCDISTLIFFWIGVYNWFEKGIWSFFLFYMFSYGSSGSISFAMCAWYNTCVFLSANSEQIFYPLFKLFDCASIVQFYSFLSVSMSNFSNCSRGTKFVRGTPSSHDQMQNILILFCQSSLSRMMFSPIPKCHATNCGYFLYQKVVWYVVLRVLLVEYLNPLNCFIRLYIFWWCEGLIYDQ